MSVALHAGSGAMGLLASAIEPAIRMTQVGTLDPIFRTRHIRFQTVMRGSLLTLCTLTVAVLAAGCSGADDTNLAFGEGLRGLESLGDESDAGTPVSDQPGGDLASGDDLGGGTASFEDAGAGGCVLECSRCVEPAGQNIVNVCPPQISEGQLCLARTAVCERQASGECDFTPTTESSSCPEIPSCRVACSSCAPASDAVVVCAAPTGSSAVAECIAERAICELQPDGACGFTQTPASDLCGATL